MSKNSSQPPSEEEARFREAMRRILSLTPEQQEAVKRKVAEEAQRTKREANKPHPEETPEG